MNWKHFRHLIWFIFWFEFTWLMIYMMTGYFSPFLELPFRIISYFMIQAD